MKEFFHTWRQIGKFKKQTSEKRRLVVYSEGQQDWPHMGPMIEEFLRQNPNEHVSYLSSGKYDPGLAVTNERLHPFYIGSGTARTAIFRSMEAKLLLMSLPDLNIYHLKKSMLPVHYVYCFHSINSSHTAYRTHAFEHYDTIFCVGPHHVQELRKEEMLKKIKPRQLLEHGSVKFDTILKTYEKHRALPVSETPFVLLAPTWGESSYLKNPAWLKQIVVNLTSRKLVCRLRLHPMTIRHQPGLIPSMRVEFSKLIEQGLFGIEDNMNDNSSLLEAAIMISDWSGAATEFAFGLERPVLFIDTPQKINNSKWDLFETRGIEDFIRDQIGTILQVNQLDEVADRALDLIENKDEYVQKIRKSRQQWIFNSGQSAGIGAKHLSVLLLK